MNLSLLPRLMLLTLLPVLLGHTGFVRAARITVNDACTLADAIAAANRDTAVGGCAAGSDGADVIVLTGDVLLTAPAQGVNGLPVVTSAITLRGGGHTIQRSPEPGVPGFRLFEISDQGDLTLENVTLAGGRVAGRRGGGGARATRSGDDGDSGSMGRLGFFIGGVGGTGGTGSPGAVGGGGTAGGAALGGAILNAGTLTLRACTLEDNATSGGRAGNGGSGSGGGEGGFGGGGGIPWTLIGILGPGGRGGIGGVGGPGGPGGLGGAAAGGAIYNQGGEVMISDCTFPNNRASGGAGGTGGTGGVGGEGGSGGIGNDYDLGPGGMGGRGGSGGAGGTGGAAQGGAIYSSGGNVTIRTSLFEDNSGTGGTGGRGGVGTQAGDGGLENGDGGLGGPGGRGGAGGSAQGGAIGSSGGALALSSIEIVGAVSGGGGGRGGDAGVGGTGGDFIVNLTTFGDRAGTTENFRNLLNAFFGVAGMDSGGPGGTGGDGGRGGAGYGSGVNVSGSAVTLTRAQINAGTADGGGGGAGGEGSLSGFGNSLLEELRRNGVNIRTPGGDGAAGDVGALGGLALASVDSDLTLTRTLEHDEPVSGDSGFTFYDLLVDAGPPPPLPVPTDQLPQIGDSGAIRAGLPADSFANPLAVDGVFLGSGGEIGSAAVINRGVIAAVDVFSLNGGSAAGGVVCLAGAGDMIFLSAADAPRVPRAIASQTVEGVTCATLPGDGTLVLVRP